MKKYRISMVVTAEDFMEIFPGIQNATVFTVDEILATDKSAPAPAPRAVRKRTSKVNETILQALNGGMARTAELKKALSDAGLSENSLSTGLAILQKNGQIRRVGDFYSSESAA